MVKKSARVFKKGSYFNNLLSAVSNLLSNNNNIKYSICFLLQGILALSTDTIKDALFCSEGGIIELTSLKKRVVVVDIMQR